MRQLSIPEAQASPRRHGSRRYPNLAHQHGPSKIGSWWTHELVGYALDRFHAKNLRTPTQREIRARIDQLPSHATVKRLYGNLGSMLRYHGYRVRPPGRQLRALHQQDTPTNVRKHGDPTFGRALRQLRAQRNLSQEQLSERSRLHRNYIGGMERGEINPTLRAIRHLADGLEMRPSQLLAALELLDVG
jgi:DNA-binding XRE family transcriptional regulator